MQSLRNVWNVELPVMKGITAWSVRSSDCVYCAQVSAHFEQALLGRSVTHGCYYI